METGFNWILAIVGGALFLIFFFFLIKTILSSSERSAEVSSTNLIVSLIKDEYPHIGIETNIDAARMISFCTPASTSFKTAKGKENPVPVERISVFAPETFDDFFLKVYKAEGPLPIGSAVAIFDKQTHIVLIKDTSNNYKIIEEALPENISKESIDLDNLKNYERKGEKTEFVFFLKDSAQCKNIPNNIKLKAKKEDIVVCVNEDSSHGRGLRGTGNIVIYKYDGKEFKRTSNRNSQNSLSSLGIFSIVGAIASQNEEIYLCNMKKSIERLHYLARISIERAKILKDGLNPPCRDVYNTLSSDNFFENPLQFLIKKTGDNMNSQQSYSEFNSPWNSIININTQLQNNNCPLLY